MTDGVYKSQGLWQVILTRNDTGADPIVVGLYGKTMSQLCAQSAFTGACASEADALRLHAAALAAFQNAPEGLQAHELRQHVVSEATAVQPTGTPGRLVVNQTNNERRSPQLQWVARHQPSQRPSVQQV